MERAAATDKRVAGDAPITEAEQRAGEIWEPIRRRLAGRPASGRAIGEFRRAAVLVPLFQAGGEIEVLLTRRTHTVEHHKGQISFPGGAVDEREELLAAALRETFEEVGIPPGEVQILGTLPEVDVTVSRFRVTPFVGAIPHPYALRPNADEIEEVVRVPLAVFRDPASLRVETLQWEGRSVEVYHYTYETQTIWGATARIMKHFVDILGEAR